LTDHPAQPLGAARSRDDGQRGLGQPERRSPGGDPDVAGQGDLKAAAEAVAVNRGDCQLGRPGQRVDPQRGLPGPSGIAADTGTSNSRMSAPAQNAREPAPRMTIARIA
jgi:hypothetical protein